MRVVGIADSDSYLKWGASTLASLPADVEHELIVVQTPGMPSRSQRRAALAHSGIDPESVARLPLADLRDRLASIRPDAVLVSTRGPIARVLIRLIARLDPRPVIVTGLPGISIPATTKALQFRRQADLFVLHSHHEVRDFAELARLRGLSPRFALARLPFAEERAPAGGTDLVFAAQAVVPAVRGDRVRVARLLRDAALADPERRVVVKVRGVAGERQTHDEQHAYPQLLAELGPLPANLVISTEPMSAALDAAEGLVTVSSTAAIEAVARGIPVLALDTFGVSDRLINPVFTGSGLFGGEAAVIGREFRHPAPAWLADNYFHDPADDTLARELRDLVAARRAGELAPRPDEVGIGGRLRMAWDRRRAFGAADRTLSGAVALAVGTPARAVYRIARRFRARVDLTAPRST